MTTTHQSDQRLIRPETEGAVMAWAEEIFRRLEAAQARGMAGRTCLSLLDAADLAAIRQVAGIMLACRVATEDSTLGLEQDQSTNNSFELLYGMAEALFELLPPAGEAGP